VSEQQVVLYRCPTRTNVLCPCGAVARRLARVGLDARVERVPYRRARRPEIEELTRQRRVPVLVDGDEVIHDSRRIVQYLDWKYGTKGDDEEKPEQQPEKKPHKKREKEASADKKKPAGLGLYNLKRWRHRKRQSS
jgi:glutathione S-transferase